jgi:large subunit ribosomal protein L17
MSMLRNLATSLINARDERIITTLPKAKELRPFVERVITLSRKAANLEGDDAPARAVHLRRQASGFFHAGNSRRSEVAGRGRKQAEMPRTAGVAALKRLFDELGERFKDRPGGYTRIIKLGRRDGDNAELAIIELVDNARERGAADSKRAKTSAEGKKKSAKPSEAKGDEGGRRGRAAAKASEKTTRAPKSEAAEKDSDKAGKGGRRSKKTESTAAEQDTK